MSNLINTFDIDGVIFMGKYDGLYPSKNDIIITGRSFEERAETEAMLASKGINNKVFYSPIPFHLKTREASGLHKAKTMRLIENLGQDIGVHFEDDPIQINEISILMPHIMIVHVHHNLVNKENMRHTI
tara:strand:- start:104 stop:490 length:387 start_codon:yes stop_codon:yes gene_type:complete